MNDERFCAFLNKRPDGRFFRLRDKTINGTLFWLTEAEAYQLRDTINDAIDAHEAKAHGQSRQKVAKKAEHQV